MSALQETPTVERDEQNESGRSSRDDVTFVAEGEKTRFPKVDMEYAATIRPSKLGGKWLMFMITFVAGSGVGSASKTWLTPVYNVWLRPGCAQ